MESEDLRLLEMSGENDSLISPLPHIDTTIDDFTFISPFRGLEDRVDTVKPGCSSRRGCSNKENINTDKGETPKLRLEPLHMKRKKRGGGGYNLRKSLAWDRAFSTEEGVLDPVELSLLSGTLVNTCREALFTINEEERIPTFNDSQHDASSAFLNSKEKSMFKDGVALKEDKRKAPSKVPVSRNGRTISRSSGCSRSLSSASLKRPAKSMTKDSKLPKFQVSKPSSCLLPTSSKSTVPRASHMKHQVTGPAVSIQKNAGIKSSSGNVRNTQEKAKANAESFKDKSSCILRGNDEKSTSRSHASTESSPPINKASNTGMEMNADTTVPSSQAHLSESHDGCAPFALRVPRSTHTAVSSTHCMSTQDMKPSGLRRPSPSVGFFRQTKASDTCRSLKAESSMCPSQRSGDLSTPATLAKQDGREILANLSCRILEFGSESSSASQVIKTGLKRNSVERVNISSVIKKLDPVIDKLTYAVNNDDEKVPDHIEHEKKKPEDAELLMNGKWHPPQTGKGEHTNKDGVLMKFIENKTSAESNFKDDQFPQASYNGQSLVLCGLEDAIGSPNEAEESGICSVIDSSNCNSQYGNMINGEVTEEVYAGPCNNLPCGAFEKVNSFAVEDDRIFDNDRHIMKIKSNLCKAQRELRNNGGGNCESLIAGSDFSEEKMENSEDASQHEVFQNPKETCPSKQIIDKKQPGGLVIEVSSEHVSDKKCETNPVGLSIYSEHASQGGIVLHSSDRSLSKHVCMDESQDEQIAETGLPAPLYRQDEDCFDRLDEAIGQTEVVSNRITLAGEGPDDIICCSPVKITLAENFNHSTDEEFNHDRIHANSTTSLEFVSSSNGTRDKMVSAAPGSMGGCRNSIEESVLEVVDEAAIRLSYRHNDSSMEFGSFSRETQDVTGSGIFGPIGEGNKLIKDKCLLEGMDEFEIRDSSNKLNDGDQLIKVKHGLLSPESLEVEELQMCSHGDSANSNQTDLGYHKVVLESLHAPQLGDTRQANKVGKATNAATDILKMEDTHLESPDNDAQLLPGKGPSTVVEERESGSAFENFRDALPARRSVDLVGLESPIFSNQESLILGSSNDADELDVIHFVEDQLSCPVAIESLSSELDSSQGTSKNHKASVRIDCTELVEGDQTSSTIKMKAVDILNQDIVVQDFDTGKPSGSESSHSELCHALEDTEQCTNDNSNLPVKNRDSCPKKGNRLILPPRDAVPFSDEWLEAMEAAGEDILTMKGGAVQNSPQEKSLPEPSPWSPVKKKNNQLGPYDCTKFHHNVLPES